MIPVLYPKNETAFASNGLGGLSDAISCEVTEERNGKYELTMEYPITGIHYADIANETIILAKPNETSRTQPFRVYHMSKPLNGIVTIDAEHISYQLSHIPVSPFGVTTPAGALSGLKSHALTACPFEFWTDKNASNNFSVKLPSSIRSNLGGCDGSVLDVYGGEYEWDRWTVKLHAARGANNGVKILYGKNLVGITQEEDMTDVATGVVPYWQKEDTVVCGDVLEISNLYQYKRIIPYDCSVLFESQPTKAQLESAAGAYISTFDIMPKITLTVDFINLGDTEEYAQFKNLERVSLCDTVYIGYPDLGVSATAKVVKTVWNVLLDKYSSIELGTPKSTLESTVAAQQKKLKETASVSQLTNAIDVATEAITGNSGGHVVLYPKKNPSELLIMDTDDMDTAVNVWRYNSAGWGHSSSGVNGPYTLAATIDGGIAADFITTGTLSANLIKTGLLQSADGTSSINMENGEFNFKDLLKFADGKLSVYGRIVSATHPNIYLDVGAGVADSYQLALIDTNFGDLLRIQEAKIIDMYQYNIEFPSMAINGAGPLIQMFPGQLNICNTYGDIQLNGEAGVRLAGTGDQSYIIKYVFKNGSSVVNGGAWLCGHHNGRNFFGGNDDCDTQILAKTAIFASKKILCPVYCNADGTWTAGLNTESTPKMVLGSGAYDTKINALNTITMLRDVIFPNGNGIRLNNDVAFRYYNNAVCVGAANYPLVLYGSSVKLSNGVDVTSDRTKKKNIVKVEAYDALNKVESLNLYNYDYIENNAHTDLGIMADEAPEEILGADGKSINLYSYCGLLAKAVQELSAKVNELEEKLDGK